MPVQPSAPNSVASVTPARVLQRTCCLTLRGLLVMIAVFCMLGGHYANRYHQHRRIVQLVNRHGGQIGFAYQDDDRHLELSERFGSLWLPDIEAIALFFTAVTDRELEVLRYCHPLRQLDLAYTQIGDSGLQRIAHLTNLERLDLKQTQVTDAGLARLNELVALESLILDGTMLSDGGIQHLAALPSLEYLSIRRTSVTDVAIERFRQTHPSCVVIH